MTFQLPDLPYSHDALGPYMGAQTLELHHGKHHNAYITKMNDAIAGTEFASQSLESIITNTYDKDEHQGLFNNASQAWNHMLFWPAMQANGGGSIPSELETRLTSDFGSVDAFKAEFKSKGAGQFGSGWVWLVEDSGQLKVTSTPNGVNPLCFNQKALLGCDVWEHSYYLDYQNRRPDYLAAFIDNLVNWEFVAQNMTEGFKIAA